MKAKNYIEFCVKFYEGLYRRRKNDVTIIQILSNIYSSTGKKKHSLRMDRRHVDLDPHNPVAHYNLACDLSLNGQVNEAVEALDMAFSLGYNDLQWLHDDVDLDPIRHHSAFKALMERRFLDVSSR
jgi:predicted Zn-dependent protease